VVIHDDGPGIEADVARTVFDPLVTTKPSGMGLGLALCRAIVKAHGGEIAATQKAGGGAQFSFWLPL
jgi:two-component system sensor kinase FixL